MNYKDFSNIILRTLLLTLCGLIGQKTHRGGLELGRSVDEEARPCVPYYTQTLLKGIDAGSINVPLIQLIQSVDYSIREQILTPVPCTPKFNQFPRMSINQSINQFICTVTRM